MKCAGNLEGAVIFNKSGVGIREDSSIYKCAFSGIYDFVVFAHFFFFSYISFLKSHLSLPKMAFIWKKPLYQTKAFFFNWYWLETYVAFGWLCLYVLQGESAGCYGYDLVVVHVSLICLCYLHITTVIWTWTFFTLTSVVYC